MEFLTGVFGLLGGGLAAAVTGKVICNLLKKKGVDVNNTGNGNDLLFILPALVVFVIAAITCGSITAQYGWLIGLIAAVGAAPAAGLSLLAIRLGYKFLKSLVRVCSGD